jgi:hypothetical protein
MRSDRAMCQSMISYLMNGLEDRKRKRDEEDDDLAQRAT